MFLVNQSILDSLCLRVSFLFLTSFEFFFIYNWLASQNEGKLQI